jgi:hypothetical protein
VLGERGMSNVYKISFPKAFKVVVDVNGLKFELESLVETKREGRWIVAIFDPETLAKLSSLSMCKVVVEKYKGAKYEYDCKEFVEFVKILGGDD